MNQGEANPTLAVECVDRRLNARTATVFRPVLLETEEFAGFCLVRNLSKMGIMGHVYTDFAENLPVTIHFGQNTKVPGTLAWCSNRRVGIRFDRSIDVDGLLAELAVKAINGKPNRAPRLQIRCQAKLVIGDRTLAIEVQNISQRGVKIFASFIRPGDELYVEMTGLERRKATVRWTKDDQAGLCFVVPLSFEQLAIGPWITNPES